MTDPRIGAANQRLKKSRQTLRRDLDKIDSEIHRTRDLVRKVTKVIEKGRR